MGGWISKEPLKFNEGMFNKKVKWSDWYFKGYTRDGLKLLECRVEGEVVNVKNKQRS